MPTDPTPPAPAPLTAKFCHGCEQTKPAGAFHRNRSTRDGLNTYCIECKRTKAGYKTRKVVVARTEADRECTKCHEVKPISEYFRNPRDGYYSSCKPCVKETRRAYYKRHRDRIWKKRRAKRDHFASLAREWAKKHPGKVQERNRRARVKFPEKQKARRLLKAAVARGRVVRMNCEVCGSHRSHGHHEDYARPYDVRWLCALHHAERHRELRHG